MRSPRKVITTKIINRKLFRSYLLRDSKQIIPANPLSAKVKYLKTAQKKIIHQHDRYIY